MMPSKLRSYGGITHFLTQRFDRIGNKKIHVQTLAAMAPSADSYEDIFAVIRRLNLPYEDLKQQYLRMVFNVIARNIDDHSKNFAFCMNPKGEWRLSPAYDVTYSVDLSAPTYVNRHSLTVNGKSEGITREDLIRVALNNDITGSNALVDTVAEGVANFETYAKDLEVDQDLIERIKADFIEV